MKRLLCILLAVILSVTVTTPTLSVSADSVTDRTADQSYIRGDADGDDNTDWTERFHQLLGMPLSKGYNTITAIWVDADLLYRPAFEPDTNKPMQLTLQKTGNDDFDAMFETWFEKNTISSYYTGAYPWTRLGYTYDWADNGTDYGLSEFIIFKGAEATVECTYDLEAFAEYAKNQT